MVQVMFARGLVAVALVSLAVAVGASPTAEPSLAAAASLPLHPAHKVEPVGPTSDDPAAATPASSDAAAAAAAVIANRQGRFLFPGLTNALTGNPSLSSVLTLNLNNLALVGLFLIGVFVLLPSVIGFLSGLAGTQPPIGFAAKQLRADDVSSSSVWGVMRTLDSVLSRNNIDVRVCLERAACHVAKNSFAKAHRGTHSSALEGALQYAISSNYGQTLLASYRLKEAADRGKNGDDCDHHYSKCPYSLGNMSKLLATYYASSSSAAAAFFPPPSPSFSAAANGTSN